MNPPLITSKMTEGFAFYMELRYDYPESGSLISIKESVEDIMRRAKK